MSICYAEKFEIKRLKEQRRDVMAVIRSRLTHNPLADIEDQRFKLIRIYESLEQIELTDEHRRSRARKIRKETKDAAKEREEYCLRQRASGATWVSLGKLRGVSAEAAKNPARRLLWRLAGERRQDFKDRGIDPYDLSPSNLMKVVDLIDGTP